MNFLSIPIIFIATGCSSRLSNTLSFTANTNLSWTRYSYNFTASRVGHVLFFGIFMQRNIYILLDDVSVVLSNDTSYELLNNPSFEDSSSSPTNWNFWCQGRCDSGSSPGDIVNTYCRTGRCYKGLCRKNDGSSSSSRAEYLVQEFPTIIGRRYIVSFWFQRVRMNNNAEDALFFSGVR